MKRSLTIAILLALGLAGQAQAYRSNNGMKVTATGAEDFVVGYDGGRGESAYWCAAAEYVLFGLGKNGTTRLFRATPVPRKIGQGVGFTLDPAKATPKNGLSVFGSRDGTISVAHAITANCRVVPPFYRD